jgi:arginase family enzyme
MQTRIVFFPFDLFGSGGAAAGADLLSEAVQEMLEDNRRERLPTRARAYQKHVRTQTISFDKVSAYQEWKNNARQIIRQALQNKELLFWITGNHLGVLPVYEELGAHGQKSEVRGQRSEASRERQRPESEARNLNSNDTLVIQFDAHLDVYNLTDCKSELSHGNFLLHREEPLPKIVNVGSRELLLRLEYIRKYYHKVFPAAELAVNPQPAEDKIRQAVAPAGRVFIDIDCDVFDSAYFPAVTHPLPFGLSPALFLRLLEAAWSDRVIGIAISEFDPARDRNDQSLATLVWLLEYLLLKKYEKDS